MGGQNLMDEILCIHEILHNIKILCPLCELEGHIKDIISRIVCALILLLKHKRTLLENLTLQSDYQLFSTSPINKNDDLKGER